MRSAQEQGGGLGSARGACRGGEGVGLESGEKEPRVEGCGEPLVLLPVLGAPPWPEPSPQ